MTYTFYIHSHTTFLTVLAIIKQLNLQSYNVVFITTRNYKINNELFTPHKTIDFSNQFVYLMKNKYRIRKTLAKTKEIDSIIQDEIGANYLAFLPHIGVFLMQIIASHPSCLEVSFIEEGSACYSKRMQAKKGLFKNNVKYLLSKFFIPSKRFWLADLLFKDLYGDLNIKCTYGISLKTFEILPYQKKIIQWPKCGLRIEINEKNPIYIFDALIEMKFVEPQLYMAAVQRMIQETAFECNYIKFHPYQTTKNKNIIKRQFDIQKASYIELDQNIIVEDIIINKENLTINGFSSSILLYAKIYKHKVNCYEELLENDKKYKAFRKLYDFEI